MNSPTKLQIGDRNIDCDSFAALQQHVHFLNHRML